MYQNYIKTHLNSIKSYFVSFWNNGSSTAPDKKIKLLPRIEFWDFSCFLGWLIPIINLLFLYPMWYLFLFSAICGIINLTKQKSTVWHPHSRYEYCPTNAFRNLILADVIFVWFRHLWVYGGAIFLLHNCYILKNSYTAHTQICAKSGGNLGQHDIS